MPTKVSNPKTDAQRSEKCANRRKKAGHEKATVSVWVLSCDKEAARAVMKYAVEEFVQPNPID